jgi:hypothetical protein
VNNVHIGTKTLHRVLLCAFSYNRYASDLPSARKSQAKPAREIAAGFSFPSSSGLKQTDALHPPATADYVPRAPTC